MSYAEPTHLASTYGEAADIYNSTWQKEDEIPHIRLENELVRRTLGDASGYRILDIAGGTGSHARRAIAAGATHVDIVDISPGMMKTGQEIEAQAGRSVMGWHVANAFEPIETQVPELPKGGYDLCMAIWPWDHAANVQDLEALWRNIATYLKPKGKLAAIRMGNPYAESARLGKYRSKFINFEPIEGGVKLQYTFDDAFTLDASSMEASYSGSTALAEKYGFEGYEVLDTRKTETVKARPEFWELMSADPHFVAFTATKK